MIDKKRTEAKDNVINFVESKKKQYINYNHWISGSSTIVYPITTWVDDDIKMTIEFQLANCDARNWRGFENVLKKKFPYVKTAYYCQYDGSCPNVYRIEIEVE